MLDGERNVAITIERFIKEWKRPVLSKIRTFPRLKEQADDVFQDITIKFMSTRYLERYDPLLKEHASLANYILTAVNRHCITSNRDVERRDTRMDQEMATFNESVELPDDVDILKLLRQVESELSKLQPWGRHTTLDGYVQERSFKVIFHALVHEGLEWSEVRDRLGYTASAMTKIKKQFLSHPVLVNFYAELKGHLSKGACVECLIRIAPKIAPKQEVSTDGPKI